MVGFLFGPGDRVVLVRKKRPSWQAGLLNGVGGLVERGESFEEAVRREFREEAGLEVTAWEGFACLVHARGRVAFYRAVVERLDVRTCTDEAIEVHTLASLFVPDAAIVPDLRLLLALARPTASRDVGVGLPGAVVADLDHGDAEPAP